MSTSDLVRAKVDSDSPCLKEEFDILQAQNE